MIEFVSNFYFSLCQVESETAAMELALKLEADKQLTDRTTEIGYGLAENSATKDFDDLLRGITGN